MDFANLDLGKLAEQPHEIELVHPENGAGLGVFVSIIGSESETFQSYMRDKANEALRKSFRQQRRAKDEPQTVEEQEELILDAIATCMTGWRTVKDGKNEPVIVWGEDKLEFNKANAIRVLKHFRWMRTQVNDATADLGNFIKA